MAISKYTIAVDRRFKRDGEPTADFINCVSFGKTAEFAEKYFRRGTKISIVGRIQTGSYTNKNGQKVYTTDIVVEEQEFAESKAANQQNNQQTAQPQGGFAQPTFTQPTFEMPNFNAPSADGFVNVPDSLEEELPFS